MARLGPTRIPLHPAHRRRPEVETRASEDLGCFDLSKGRTENPKTPHEVSDEVGKPVHRFGQTDERIRAFLIETPHPGSDGERGHQEDPGSLGEGPATCGPKLEDRQTLGGRIMWTSMRLKLLHAGILDADLLAEQLDLLLEPVVFGLPP
jgi:hypothetical protein